MQGKFAFVKVSYSDGSSKEGYLVDITDGVGTLQAVDGSATAFSVSDVVLDVLVPVEGQSMLVNYPFERDDVVIFRDGQDHLQGRYARRAEREGGILVFAGGNLIGVFYAHIVRVRKPTCDFHVPPAYLATHEQIPTGNSCMLPAEGPQKEV